MSALLILGLSPAAAIVTLVVAVLVLIAACWGGLLTYANPPEGPAFAIPRGIVLVLGAVCFAVFLAEGTVLDWSAVFLVEHHRMPENLGGLGFACFSVTMTTGRLIGDRVVARLGAFRVVLSGALTAAAGLALVILMPSWLVALAGYALVGAGCANIVPVMFSAIGRQTRMPQAVAVPAVTTLAYIGVLAGPASIGFVAHHASLPVAFWLICGLLLLVASVSRVATR